VYHIRTMIAAIIRGALGFAAVGVAAFSVWAFGGKAFKGRGGEPAMYAAITLVFLGLSGLVLHPLVEGPRRLWRFYKVFIPAFLAYAAVWCAFWAALKFGPGEWLGSAGGSAAFALVAGLLLGNRRAIPKGAAALFVTHSIGYFAGGPVFYGMHKTHPQLGMLLWGVIYGLGFGAGLGYVFFISQRPAELREGPSR